MAIEKHVLEGMLREAFPQAIIEVKDLAGDNDHYQVTVLSSEFEKKTRIQQHQTVYQALQGKVGNELHALALKTGILP
jgi:stress-induced morphogen